MRRKGFYFSVDALMALLVMLSALALVAQSSDFSTADFSADTVEYESSTIQSQDAMKLSSEETFSALEQDFQDDLVEETVMTEDDLDRTILDGVALLWAARNLTHAEQVAQKYFDSKIDGDKGYRLQINESGDGSIIYETGSLPDSAGTVSSSSRLVSGHRIDEPSEGFQARARATEAKTNITRVIDIPMMGSAANTNELLLERRFDLDADEIHEATLFFSMQWGQSNFNSNEVMVNGEVIEVGGSGSEDWLYYEDKDGGQIGFDRADITDEVESNWNDFTVEFNNQDDQRHARVQPGTRLKVTYSTTDGIPQQDYSYFTDVESTAQNPNQRGGVWYHHPMYLPEGASINDAVLELEMRNLRNDDDDKDLQIFLNDQLVEEDDVSGDISREVDLSSYMEYGNNVLSIYGNVELNEGEVVDFTGYDENPRIYSDPENDPESSTRVLLDYERPDGELEFGEIEVSIEEEVGGATGNPKEFSRQFDDINLTRAFINLAQMDNLDLTAEAGADGLEEVFSSPRDFATPSRIEIDTDLLEEGEENEFRLEDECTEQCYFLPESGLQLWASVPNQVGYGELFETEDEALDDAEERLEERMGEFAEATNIELEELSTGGQPYIWGPASVKLVIWDE